MKKLSKTEAIKMFPHIWTVFLCKDDDLWAEPFSFRKRRYRCFFKKESKPARLTVYLHLTEEEIKSLLPLPEQVYFYGAFNQMTVYQMRAFGNIREMTGEEKEEYMKLLKARTAGKKTIDNLRLRSAFTDKEKEEAWNLAQSGKFYRFDPLDYAYNTYERG